MNPEKSEAAGSYPHPAEWMGEEVTIDEGLVQVLKVSRATVGPDVTLSP